MNQSGDLLGLILYLCFGGVFLDGINPVYTTGFGCVSFTGCDDLVVVCFQPPPEFALCIHKDFKFWHGNLLGFD